METTKEMQLMFAKNLHRLMARKGLQRTTLATTAKLSHKTVAAVLDGELVPSPEQINSLAKALGVGTDDFYR